MNSTVKVDNIFTNLIAIKNLDISKLKIVGKDFKKTFESNIKTTLNQNTLLNIDSMNYLNINFPHVTSKTTICTFKYCYIKITSITDTNYQTN